MLHVLFTYMALKAMCKYSILLTDDQGMSCYTPFRPWIIMMGCWVWLQEGIMEVLVVNVGSGSARMMG